MNISYRFIQYIYIYIIEFSNLFSIQSFEYIYIRIQISTLLIKKYFVFLIKIIEKNYYFLCIDIKILKRKKWKNIAKLSKTFNYY